MANGEKCNNKDCRIIITEHRKNGQYKKYCCSSCRRLGVSEKVKQTSLLRYGVTNPSKADIIKDRIKESFTEKYGEGITNAMNIAEFRQKIKDTNIERHGTATPQLLEKFENKSKQTCLEKYGVEKPQRLKELKEKSKNTCMEKYGVSAPQQNKVVRKKSIDTCLEKYGSENVMQSKDIFDKNRYYLKKDYVLPSGKIVKVQGYEDKCINLLLKTYTEDELWINPSLPSIYYVEVDGKKHRYYPDIYIPEENLIIEVKSLWTYSSQQKWYTTNLLKRQACIDAGYNFKFMIFNKDGELINE
jgi:hypothetical protein